MSDFDLDPHFDWSLETFPNIALRHDGLLRRKVMMARLRPQYESDCSRTLNMIVVGCHASSEPFATIEAGDHQSGRWERESGPAGHPRLMFPRDDQAQKNPTP
jgi:hypothetical protein